jgi:hypothetical protein
VAAPVLTYRNAFGFDLSPDRLWHQIEAFDRFEGWWPWLTDLTITGEGLSTGSILCGTVNPPLPYRMRLRVELVSCTPSQAIDASIDGDLTGHAHLRFHPDGKGTRIDASWTVEMQQPAMRLASRISRPLLQWGHDRVVEMTVAGFRRRIRDL